MDYIILYVNVHVSTHDGVRRDAHERSTYRVIIAVRRTRGRRSKTSVEKNFN